MRKRSQAILVCTLLPILCGGCAGRPLLGPFLARSNSLQRTNQQTKIRWLNASAMREPPPGVEAATWANHLARECPIAAADGRPKVLPSLLLPLVPIATELALDSLNRQLLAESKLYAAQFSATAATDDAREIVGFELRRTTERYGDDTPACVMRFAICRNEATGLAIVRPIFFQTRASRAKLLLIDRTLCTRVDLFLSGTTKDGTTPIGSGTLKIDDYDLAGGPLLLAHQAIAVVPWPPPGVIRATLLVTETDAHHSDETFTQLSTLLSEHRTALLAATSNPLTRKGQRLWQPN